MYYHRGNDAITCVCIQKNLVKTIHDILGVFMNESINKFDKVIGPIRLPLEVDGQVDYHQLYYFESNNERWACVSYGDIHNHLPVPLRIESACFFGHVFHSRQCDCGYQLTVAFERIRQEGRGLVIYGIDQDARGLGIGCHFSIYDLRQNENLDTEAVFQRLNAKLDNRNYDAVAHILRFIQVDNIKLLSNNAKRIEFLKNNGFIVEREELEAPLDRFNMATMMLEKEDLGYQWSFQTHAHWLSPIQQLVEENPKLFAGRIVANNKQVIAEWVGEEWGVAAHLRAQYQNQDLLGSQLVVYLTDYPRLDELKIYSEMGVKFIVMPYTTFPDSLIVEADQYGIKLQDWARENKYSKERIQWQFVSSEGQHHVYERNGEILKIAC